MKTASSYKVQYLLDALGEMTYEEVREFRKRLFDVLGKDLGLDHIAGPQADDDGDSPAGASMPRNPRPPVLTGSAIPFDLGKLHE